MKVSFDFETFSKAELKKCGGYKYAADPSTQIFCLAVRVDDGPVRLWLSDYGWQFHTPWDLPAISTAELRYLVSAADTFHAWNANFERNIWREVMHKRYGFEDIGLRRWRCTAAKAAALALPRSLEEAGKALCLPIQKDKEGHKIMMKWCKPRKPTKNNPAVIHSDADEFKKLCSYCITDVETEASVDASLSDLPEDEQEMWFLDQEINDRGVCVDVAAIENLQAKVMQRNAWLVEEVPTLGFAGILKPTQTKKIVALLNEKGIETDSIDAEHLKEILARKDLDAKVRRLLEIRQLTNKTSVSKLQTMKTMVQADGRVRGSLLYHGGTTGRWAAKGLQLHNYPRTDYKDEDVDQVVDMNLFDLESTRGSVHSVVSKSLRGMLRASPGKQLIGFDFSNIEGRMAAWLAGETWKVQSFFDYDTIVGTKWDEKKQKEVPVRKGPDNYVLAYSKSFNVPIEEVDDDGRQAGKTQELALQFQGWVGALMGMAEKFGLFFSDEVATDLCGRWRDAHPMIKQMWYSIGDCAIYAIRNRKTYTYRGIKIGLLNGYLKVVLPSGRMLSYYKPYLFQKEHYGKMKTCIGYWGAHKKTGKLCTTMSTHGGDIFQSIVQGAARDCLGYAMTNLNSAGFNLVMHVHDECETDEELDRKEEMRSIMSQVPPWAEGLPMAVDGFRGTRYRK